MATGCAYDLAAGNSKPGEAFARQWLCEKPGRYPPERLLPTVSLQLSRHFTSQQRQRQRTILQHSLVEVSEIKALTLP